jgi:hypothetical protein
MLNFEEFVTERIVDMSKLVNVVKQQEKGIRKIALPKSLEAAFNSARLKISDVRVSSDETDAEKVSQYFVQIDNPFFEANDLFIIRNKCKNLLISTSKETHKLLLIVIM